PDGAWAVELDGSRLRLYDLQGAAYSPNAEPAPAGVLEPLDEIVGSEHPGRVVFVAPDRVMWLWMEPAALAEDQTESVIGQVLSVPTLDEAARLLRVPGAQRIAGVGAGGAVVSPLSPGADVIALRGNELVLLRTYLRTDVLSAIAAPERRFLLEQRGGFELW